MVSLLCNMMIESMAGRMQCDARRSTPACGSRGGEAAAAGGASCTQDRLGDCSAAAAAAATAGASPVHLLLGSGLRVQGLPTVLRCAGFAVRCAAPSLLPVAPPGALGCCGIWSMGSTYGHQEFAESGDDLILQEARWLTHTQAQHMHASVHCHQEGPI